MDLRKTLAVGTAVLATGLLNLAPIAIASTPTGGDAAYIGVNGPTTPGNVVIDGIFRSGTATVLGDPYGCTGGSASGTVRRGLIVTGPEMTFAAAGLSLVCSTPLGNATIDNTCPIDLNFDSATGATNVHDGLSDTGSFPIPPGAKTHVVPGIATFSTTPCVRGRVAGGLCTFNVTGTPLAYWDEAIKTVGGVDYQDLILNGSGTLVNQTAGCFGLMGGIFTLNAIRFGVKVSSGTTTGIDFRLT